MKGDASAPSTTGDVGVASAPDVRALLVLLVAVAGAYASARDACFFWDDITLLLDNPVVREVRVAQALFGDLWAGTAFATPFHRPFVTLSFLLDHALFGTSPTGWHLHSLAWHLLAVAGTWSLVARRMGTAAGTLAAGIVGLHPVQSEAVLWIAARNDVVCAALLVWALALQDGVARGARGVGRQVGIALLAAGAALSKEVGYLLPLAWLAWTYACGDARPTSARAWVREHVGMLVGLALAGALRASAHLGDMGAGGEALVGLSIPAAVARCVALTLGWLTLPWPLTSTASAWSLVGPAQWAAAALTLLAAGWVVRRWRGAALLLAFAALAWAPSVVGFLRSGLVGERYLYLPVVFVGCAVAGACVRGGDADARRGSPSPRALAGAGLAGLASLVLLGVRLSDWISPVALLRAAAERAPDSYSLGRYAMELRQAGDRADARRASLAGMAIAPQMPKTCIDGVDALIDEGAPDEALRVLDQLTGTPCAELPQILTARARANWAAGHLQAAWTEVRAWRWPPPDDIVDVHMALCLARRDFDCAQSLAMAWPDGASELRARGEWMRAWVVAAPTPGAPTAAVATPGPAALAPSPDAGAGALRGPQPPPPDSPPSDTP